MKEENSKQVQWYRGIPLRERIARGDRPRAGSTPLGDRRLQRWRSQTPFPNNIYFAQRLASDGLTEPEFQQLLEESPETLARQFLDPPDWIKTLSDILSTYPFSALSETGNLSDTEVSGFLTLFSPLIAWGRSRLQQKLQTLLSIHSPQGINSQTLEAILYEPLPQELLWMSTRTLVLELNVARLQGKLSGNSSAERFSQFIQQLQQPETALALWSEYPVLTRQILSSIQRWITVSYEFVERLCQDWSRIIQQFSPDSEPGILVHLNRHGGDPHHGGRSVAIAEFSSGFKLVYKPRSLSIDIHFQKLLNWLNERGNHPPFQILNVLNCGEYGWVEYVTPQPCSCAPQIERFYQRQGGYLALLYALQATDFYSNNIIAVGEQPILVDLESLFHPRYSQLEGFNSESLAERELDRSVLSVGILPMNLWGNQGYGGIDISGLGNSGSRMTPDAIPTWQGVGTDEMKVSRQAVLLPPDLNRPTLNGASVNWEDYTAAMIKGFTEIYRVLVENRDNLVGESGLLNEFADDEIRVVLRATRTYGLLLQEGFHPDLLRDALERDRLFDKLWVEVPNFPSLARAIPAEIQDLWQGDIPRFTTQPNSRHLESSQGETISDFLPESSLDSVRIHLQGMDETNLERQIGLIRAAIATVIRSPDSIQWPSYPMRVSENRPSSTAYLNAACAIGDRLEQVAFCQHERADWIGLTWIGEGQLSIRGVDIHLYDGLPGISLFLAYLGNITQEIRYQNLAIAALNYWQVCLEKELVPGGAVGGFTGLGSVIYSLSHLAIQLNQPQLISVAKAWVNCLPEAIAQDEQWDIIAGAAGCILGLLSLYAVAPDPQILDVAIQCGDRLIIGARPQETGIGWIPATIRSNRPLTGFSHGAAGIAYALLELAAVTQLERFQKAATAAIAYERSVFDPDARNWPDFREFDHSQRVGNRGPLAWSHGAPGIGLARLYALQHQDDQQIRQEIYTALDITCDRGFGQNHSLAQGDLGNLELVLQASLTLGEPQWHSHLHTGGSILESIQSEGWLCGTPLGVETPGLMSGLAGIGYGLLRLATPETVSSVLALRPPILSPQSDDSEGL